MRQIAGFLIPILGLLRGLYQKLQCFGLCVMSSLNVIRNFIEADQANDLAVREIGLPVAFVRLLHVWPPVDRGEATPVGRVLQ